MRHNKSFNHLGRKSGHRKAMLANMASSLILNKRIETTLAKAKALRMYVEPLITKSKEDTTHSRRMVFSYLKQKEAVTELFRVIAPKIADRPGGYTRIIKNGFRLGDAADMAIMELVDFNETALASGTTAKEAVKKPSTRRGGVKKVADSSVEEPKVAKKESVKKTTPAKKSDVVEKVPVAKKEVVKKAPVAKKETADKKAAPAKKAPIKKSAPKKEAK